MLRALYQQQLDPSQCLDLLSMLRSVIIHRRVDLPQAKGFISLEDLKDVFLPVMRLCLIQMDLSSFDFHISQEKEYPPAHAQALIAVTTSFKPAAHHVLVNMDRIHGKEL